MKILTILLLLFSACSAGTSQSDNASDLPKNESIADSENARTTTTPTSFFGKLPEESYNGFVIVKFKEESGVRYQAGQFIGREMKDLEPINAITKVFPIDRVFRARTVEEYDDETKTLRRTLSTLKDRNLYFQLTIPTADKAWKIVEQLSPSSIIETVYMDALPVNAAAPTTPDYQGNQGYLQGNALNGINAIAAWAIPGGNGQGVSIVDIEYGWNVNHEDLPQNITILSGTMTTGAENINHGTAVAGVLVGINDGFGITGVVPAANLDVVSLFNQPTAAAIDFVTAIIPAPGAFGAGDIILLEAQIMGPDGTGQCIAAVQTGCVPAEWSPATKTAIQAATAANRIVVEAAGNGNNNLDDAVYGNIFNPAINNSGAIMVGAGNSATRRKLDFSNFGARVNLQGWGHNVMTTGYGPTVSGVNYNSGLNREYTPEFNGTSSASSIVVGAIAALQGIYRDTMKQPASSQQLLNFLVQTGTSQPAEPTPIGPLPNLQAAIVQMNLFIAPNADPDNDGLTNSQEATYGTDPTKADTDGDGFNDGVEVNQYKTDPKKPDTDGDELSDGDEINKYGTSPTQADSDGDGLSDGDEVNKYGTSPTQADSDGDGLSDGDEVNKYGSSPTQKDSDGDGLEDGAEINSGTNPTVNEPAIIAIISGLLLDDDCIYYPQYKMTDCEIAKAAKAASSLYEEMKKTISMSNDAYKKMMCSMPWGKPEWCKK